MSFLSPEDAELLHRGRLALPEFVPLYEARRAKQLERAPQFKSPQGVYECVRFEMEDLDQEQMRVINLNTKNRIISAPMIYQGSLHTTAVRLAEIFRPAIIENASGIVVVHNHPSGENNPSPEDVALTREIDHAGCSRRAGHTPRGAFGTVLHLLKAGIHSLGDKFGKRVE